MKFFARRRLKHHPNLVVRLAVSTLDKPTRLKEHLLDALRDGSDLRPLLDDALEVFSTDEIISNDIRLAFLRATCTANPNLYSEIFAKYPELMNDERAVKSMDFYKQKTLDEILEIENTDEDNESDQESSIYKFDDTMFEHLDYTEYESKFDDDYGLIEFADDEKRTLNQLRDRVARLFRTEESEVLFALLRDIQFYLLQGDYSNRAKSDFFVASLRSLGEEDTSLGVKFGKKFLNTIPDHRALRSMVVFLRRSGMYVDALRLLHHPDFRHDDTTLGWVNELTELHKELILDGKLSPKYAQFGQDWIGLENYMETLFESMDFDIEIARYNYGFALKTHKGHADRPFASSVIKWGELLLNAAPTYSDTVSIHVSNAYINLGEISKAINILETFGNPKSIRIAAKIKGYNDLLNLRNNGFKAEISVPATDYEPKNDRILYVLHNSLPYNSGGYATRSHGLMCGVKKQGWDVQVVTRRGYPHDRKGMNEMPIDDLQIVDDIPYHRLIELEKGYGQVNINAYLQAYANHLAEMVRELKPAVIHAASNHINGLVANAVAQHFGIPSIYEVRGLWEITRISRQPEFEGSEYFEMMSRLEAQSASDANYVFTITHALADEMRSRTDALDEIGFLPNGVHSNRFTPLEPNLKLKDSLNISQETVVLGYIGSLVSYEGLDLLIESLPLVKEQTNVPFKLLIVGDGAYMQKLQSLTTNLDLSDEVLFTGRVPHEEVEEYYSIVDIAPFPRLPQPVTEMVSPLKPFEAMAMEKAVLASNVKALAEIVSDNETGILFSKGDSQDLSVKLTELIENPNLRSNLGISARSWVCKERDWAKISTDLGSIYSNLLVSSTKE